jgi:hypothetical protein
VPRAEAREQRSDVELDLRRHGLVGARVELDLQQPRRRAANQG